MNEYLLELENLHEEREIKLKGLSNEKINTSKIKDLINNFDFINSLNKIIKKENLSYADIKVFAESFKDTFESLKHELETIESDNFFLSGKNFDIDKIKKRFDIKGVFRKFINFKWEKFVYYLENPLTSIKNFRGEIIEYDQYLVKKLTTSVIQALSDEMDIRKLCVGPEGTGKTCLSSQLMKWYEEFLFECGLISKRFDFKRSIFSSMQSMLQEQDSQEPNDYFRYFNMDEGYSLNKQNYKDQSVISYKDDMRSDRKLLRLMNINLPQLGELDLSISMTRTNFIFDCIMDTEKKTGMLKKGIVNMYIIPRGQMVYSPFLKKDLSQYDIKSSFARTFASKLDYYSQLPQDVIIHQFKFSEVWGFDKDKYDEYIKKENKKRRLEGNTAMSDYIAFIMYKMISRRKLSEFFDLKNQSEMKMYKAFQKWYGIYIAGKFKSDIDKLTKFELLYYEKETVEKVSKIKNNTNNSACNNSCNDSNYDKHNQECDQEKSPKFSKIDQVLKGLFDS